RNEKRIIRLRQTFIDSSPKANAHYIPFRLILEMTQAEFLEQAWHVVWVPADNFGHLVTVSVSFFEGFEQTAPHGLARGTIQGFLVEERIAIRFQRAFQIFNA